MPDMSLLIEDAARAASVAEAVNLGFTEHAALEQWRNAADDQPVKVHWRRVVAPIIAATLRHEARRLRDIGTGVRPWPYTGGIEVASTIRRDLDARANAVQPRTATTAPRPSGPRLHQLRSRAEIARFVGGDIDVLAVPLYVAEEILDADGEASS